MDGVKGNDLVRMCSTYEKYKFRTSPRLLQTSSQQGELSSAALRRGRKREEMLKNYRMTQGCVDRPEKPPNGKMRLKGGEDETSLVAKLRRCRIGDERAYRHAEPPLTLTSNKLPPITKKKLVLGKESKHTPTPDHSKPQAAETTIGEEISKTDIGKERPSVGDADEDSAEDGDDPKEKKLVSFGRARVVNDRRFTKAWRTYPAATPVQLKYTGPWYHETLVKNHDWHRKALPPQRGKQQQLRHSGRRNRPANPSLARLKESSNVAQTQLSPMGVVSILKPPKPFMVIPTPCFPCSPEFERTFKSLRHHRK